MSEKCPPIKFCKNCDEKKAQKGRNICGRCRSSAYTRKHPIRRVYADLRANAKRRGKEFTITYKYFERWIKKTPYMQGRGRGSEDLNIDRKKEKLGYVPGNLQVIECKYNVQKYYIDRAERLQKEKQKLRDECPF